MSFRPTAGLRRERLSNGVTLLVARCRTAPAAALVTHVRAGFLDEPDALVGISHVLEHMLFKGTPSLGPGELARRTKSLGGWLNAYTAYDRTVYYASVPARHAGELIALQADQVRNPLLDADELRRELGVIIQEANRKLDTPGAVAGETLHQLLFDRHRIRRWRIGVAEMLERFSRDDVAGYYGSRYVPARAIVSLVADLDEDIALDLLRSAWSNWSRPEETIDQGPREETLPTVRTRRMMGDVALAQLVVGWRASGTLDADAPALELATVVLSHGRASRLARLLRESGLAGSVGSSHYGVPDVGVFTVAAELEASRLDAVLSGIGTTIHDLAEHEVAPSEFERARALLRLRIRRRFERYEARAIALAEAEAMGEVTRLDREEADLLAVTPEELRRVVARYLTADRVSAVLYAPDTSAVAFDADTLTSAMRTPSRRPTDPMPPGPATRPGGRHIAARLAGPGGNVPPTSGAAGPNGITQISTGGLDVLAARHGSTGQVTLAVYRNRIDQEDRATAGLALLGMRAMMRATRRHDAGELALAAESLGGVIAPILGADILGLSMTVLAEDITRAAELLVEVLAEPRFDQETVAIERRVLADDARAAADDMMRAPFQLALGVAFADAGYGSPILGTAESLATFDAGSVRRWHERTLAQGTTTVIAVGDAEPERLTEMLVPIFAPFAVSEHRARNMRPRAAPMTMHHGTRIEQRVRQQSALALIFPGPSRTSPDRHAAEVWAAIASGLGGRLFEILRSERSLAYTVTASSWQRRHAGALTAYIAMAPERLNEARDAMFAELERFRIEPPTEAEVVRATATLAGEAEMSRQTAAALAGEIADAWLLGEGLGELVDPAAPYRAVDAQQVLAVAGRAFDPSGYAEGVVEAAES